MIPDDAIEDDAPAVEPSRKITYDVVVYSLKELAKQRGRRAEARFIELESDLTWVDFWGQIKIKITDILFPHQPIVGDDYFKVTYTISRHVPNPLPLGSEGDYGHLIKNALKISVDPKVKVIVHQTSAGDVSINLNDNRCHLTYRVLARGSNR